VQVLRRRLGGNIDARQISPPAARFICRWKSKGGVLRRRRARRASDADVCITAIEMDSVTQLRFGVGHTPIAEPRLGHGG
jgi:hypothetical protein